MSDTPETSNFIKGLADHLAFMFPEGTRQQVAKAAADYVLASAGFGRFVNAYSEQNQSDRNKRYIEAARRRWHDDGQIEIDDHPVVSDGADNGAYVMAWVWASDDDFEPEPGPTYAVWFAEQEQVDSAPGGDFPGPWTWTHDQDFTCDDDPDGRGARRSAHEYARHLRNTYPCAYVAVLPAGKRPLPIRADG